MVVLVFHVYLFIKGSFREGPALSFQILIFSPEGYLLDKDQTVHLLQKCANNRNLPQIGLVPISGVMRNRDKNTVITSNTQKYYNRSLIRSMKLV